MKQPDNIVKTDILVTIPELTPANTMNVPATFERNETVRIEAFSDGVFAFIQRTDHPFLYWNGLLLLFITFMPFPTALLAEYLLHPDDTAAGAVFAGTYVASSFAFKGLWNHASKNGRLLAENVDDREIRQITMQYRYAPLLCLLAFALSFVSVGLSVGLCLCLAVFFAVKGWPTLISAVLFFPSFPRKR